MSQETNLTPLRNDIIVNLVKHQGELLDTDLLRNLRKTRPEMSKRELDKALMALEVRGAVFVERIKKTQNKITLRTDNGVINTSFQINYDQYLGMSDDNEPKPPPRSRRMPVDRNEY
jgi:Fe2+ or Zn2+ uptake regulation protein